jgi:hypothetical protein
MTIKITHGIFIYEPFEENTIVVRMFNKKGEMLTDRHLPLPLKFRKLLETKYIQWWYVKTSIYRFNKRLPIRMLVEEPVEFTIGHDPDTDVMVISIVHPLDHFCKKAGYRIVLERMEWALENPDRDKSWKYELKREGCEHEWKYFEQGIFNYRRCSICNTLETLLPEVKN